MNNLIFGRPFTKLLQSYQYIKKNLKSMATLFLHKKLDLPHHFHQLDELFPLEENTYFFCMYTIK